MKVSTTSLRSRVQRLGVATLAAATFSVALGVGASSASTTQSAAMSPFCKTLTTFHPKSPPASNNYTAYRAWSKQYLPFFQRLASQAPNAATKTLMNDLVQYVKAGANATSAKALGAYLVAHRAQWTKGWKAFISATMACVTSLY
ncbi:MAG: hypothetical protein KGJ39_01320 [Acidobacteriota bacterium]|nr:hypothetical protein [Acidobacteriota bacterium]